jgi:hypothetical protein
MRNKFPLVQILVLFTLFCASLTACTAAPALSPIAAIKIETPTVTVTEPPPATATATATEDPMAGAPDGATGKDEKGYYKEVDGVKFYQALDSKGEVLVGGWFADHIKNPTYNDGIQAGDRDIKTVSIRFSVKEGLNAPYLSHENTDEQSRFSLMFYTKLIERYLNKSFKDVTNEDAAQFWGDLDSGRVSIPVTDAQGNTFELPINDKTKVNIFLAEPGDFTPDFEVSFLQSVTTYDSEGTINIIVASTKSIETLSDTEFIELVLFPFFRIIISQDQSKEVFISKPKNSMAISTLTDMAIKEPNPHFQIEKTSP